MPSPVHVLREFVARLNVGDRLFPRVTKDTFNATLKRRAFVIAMKDAPKVSSKAFRRGHSRDLHNADCPSARLLRYAGWNSKAIFNYVPLQTVIEKATERVQPPLATRVTITSSDTDSDTTSESDSSGSSSSS
jgi:hypothetical protein